MNKTCIIYGSSTGTCENIAQQLADKLGVDSADVYNAADISADTVADYKNLLLGTSTWGAGELQDDWYDGLKALKAADLNGKVVAIFGCGDCESYCDTFCGGMGELYEGLEGSGATFVGAVSTDGYSYDDSTAVVDGKFIGLALDDVNEDDKTESRLDAWVEEIKPSL